jgi:hypothetical protein
VLNVIRRRIRLRSLRPSFKQDLLRIPGGSQLMRLDNLNEQINVYLVYVILLLFSSRTAVTGSDLDIFDHLRCDNRLYGL